MPTGIELSSGVVVGAPKPLDAKYGPYSSAAAALADIGAGLRYRGLTVGILQSGTIQEYWFANGVADTDFIVKLDSSVSSVSSVNGQSGAVSLDQSNIPSSYGNNSLEEDISELYSGLDQKQPAGSYATLVSGKIPAAQLPSYVDDVIELANLAAIQATAGESGKIYVAADTNKTYRWSGTAYVEISASPGTTDSVPEGSVNLYHTTARASAAAPVQSVAGKTGSVALVKSDVGLGNVDNTSDANKPISSATQTALNNKADITHSHVISDVTNLTNALNGKAPLVHTHQISEVSGLQSALDGKQPSGNYATLINGQVPLSQLPASLDDVVQGTSLSNLPAAGESGKLYLTTNDNKIYRWDGTTYIQIVGASGGAISIEDVSGLEQALNGKQTTYFDFHEVTLSSNPATFNPLPIGRRVFTKVLWPANPTPGNYIVLLPSTAGGSASWRGDLHFVETLLPKGCRLSVYYIDIDMGTTPIAAFPTSNTLDQWEGDAFRPFKASFVCIDEKIKPSNGLNYALWRDFRDLHGAAASELVDTKLPRPTYLSISLTQPNETIEMGNINTSFGAMLAGSAQTSRGPLHRVVTVSGPCTGTCNMKLPVGENLLGFPENRDGDIFTIRYTGAFTPTQNNNNPVFVVSWFSQTLGAIREDNHPDTRSVTVRWDGRFFDSQNNRYGRWVAEPIGEHSHFSAEITDATNEATPLTLVKRDSGGGAQFSNVRGTYVESEGLYLGKPGTNFGAGVIFNTGASNAIRTIFLPQNNGILATTDQITAPVLGQSLTVVDTSQGSYNAGDTIPAGTSLETVVRNMLTTVVPATYTAPSLTTTLSNPPNDTFVELGTTIAPTVTPVYSTNDGGSSTGFTIQRNIVADNIFTDIYVSGTIEPRVLSSFTVGQSNVRIRVRIDYAQGPQKNNNLGQPSGTPIPAGSVSFERQIFGGRRSYFTADTASSAPNSSVAVRNLTSAGVGLVDGSKFTFTAPIGTTRLVVAYPSNLGNISAIRDITTGFDIKAAFGNPVVVSVEGANGYAAINYNVYTLIGAPYNTAASYEVTI